MLKCNELNPQVKVSNEFENKPEIKIMHHPISDAKDDTLKRMIQCLVRENILKWSVVEEQLIINFPKSNQKLVAQKVKLFYFSRLNILGKVLLHSTQIIEPITIEKLLTILRIELSNIPKDRFEQFEREIKNNVNNTSISLRQSLVKNKIIKQFAKHNAYETIYDVVENSQHAPALYFEQFASRGHPFHPCNKTKLGFSEEDITRYCPEFNPKVTILICALHKNVTTCEFEQQELDYLSWFNAQHPEQMVHWQRMLDGYGVDAADYLPIPVHPWQAKHMLPKLFAALIQEKKLIIFTEVAFTYRPSLSFRTLVPVEKNKFQIKLPVAVQATSAVRTVSPASIHNSPQISGVLRKILQQEPAWSKKLIILMDSIGIRINDPNPERAKHLSALYRDNIEQYIEEGEIVIVSSALFQISPISNCAVISELINATCDENIKTHCLDYFQQLSQLLIGAYLSLYVKYGIAMEAHQQNTFIVFKDKLPKKTIIRDLGGLRIHQETLESRGYKLKPFQDSATITSDLKEVRNKLQHSLYQCQFNELIVELSEQFDIPEEQFWEIIAKQTKACINGLGDEVSLVIIERELEAFFQAKWVIKSLLAMRLCGAYNKYVYSENANPLALFKSKYIC